MKFLFCLSFCSKTIRNTFFYVVLLFKCLINFHRVPVLHIFFIEFKHTLDTSNIILPEKGSSGIKCSDGSSIPKVNWCNRNFDCKDYKDELSCQNDIIRKYIIEYYLSIDENFFMFTRSVSAFVKWSQ
jgi:hypothetical protein